MNDLFGPNDQILNNTWHQVWIDHALYSGNQDGPWVSNAHVHRIMAGDSPIWRKYKHASDHFPVSVNVNT